MRPVNGTQHLHIVAVPRNMASGYQSVLDNEARRAAEARARFWLIQADEHRRRRRRKIVREVCIAVAAIALVVLVLT